jgi:DNA polymerase-3 subunit gamma/tau
MLKLIEEPPAKTVFIFCTTDPQKIPATILSRVQRYDFQRITYGAILERLGYIVEQEGVEYEKSALEYIAKLAEGGMRDAITLLDKCLSFAENLALTDVIEVLGAVDYDTMFALLDEIILYRDAGVVVRQIGEIHRAGIDLKQFMRQFCWFLLDVCKYGLLGSFEYLQLPETYKKDLDEFDTKTYEAASDLLRYVLKLNNQIKWDPNAKALIEAHLILYCRGDE